MVAEAGAYASHCSELQRFITHCAAVLNLPVPSDCASTGQGPGTMSKSVTSSFGHDLEAKRRVLEDKVNDIKVTNR
jgi:hypothetical protein